MAGAVALVLVLVGCAPVRYGSLATSTAMLACDWSQTRSGAEHGWKRSREANPILGPMPPPWLVDGYFTTAVLVNAFVWLVMPSSVDWVMPTALTGTQAYTVHGNLRTTPGFCGR